MKMTDCKVENESPAKGEPKGKKRTCHQNVKGDRQAIDLLSHGGGGPGHGIKWFRGKREKKRLFTWGQEVRCRPGIVR